MLLFQATSFGSSFGFQKVSHEESQVKDIAAKLNSQVSQLNSLNNAVRNINIPQQDKDAVSHLETQYKVLQVETNSGQKNLEYLKDKYATLDAGRLALMQRLLNNNNFLSTSFAQSYNPQLDAQKTAEITLLQNEVKVLQKQMDAVAKDNTLSKEQKEKTLVNLQKQVEQINQDIVNAHLSNSATELQAIATRNNLNWNSINQEANTFVSQILQNIAKTIYMNSLAFMTLKRHISSIQSANSNLGRAMALALGKTFSDYLKSEGDDKKESSQEKAENEVRKMDEAKERFANLLKANMILNGVSASSITPEMSDSAFIFANELNSGSVSGSPGAPGTPGSASPSAIRLPNMTPDQVRLSVSSALAPAAQATGPIRFTPVRTGG